MENGGTSEFLDEIQILVVERDLGLQDRIVGELLQLGGYMKLRRGLCKPEAEEYDEDDPMNLVGEDDEQGLPTHDINESVDATKPVQLEKEVKDMEPDVPAVESPTKSHDSEDELYLWSQYKSFVYHRDNLLLSLEGIEILKLAKVLDLSFDVFKGPGFEPLEAYKALHLVYALRIPISESDICASL